MIFEELFVILYQSENYISETVVGWSCNIAIYLHKQCSQYSKVADFYSF